MVRAVRSGDVQIRSRVSTSFFMQETSAILVLRDVSKSVRTAAGELRILEGISVEIKRGESVAVVGASGSGKTTLLGLMAGLDVPTSGRILFDGHDLTSMDEEERAHLRGRLVGFVFQTFQLLGSLTALENVMLPIELRGDSSAQSAAAEVLRRVGLGERFDHYPKQLSGGEQQRVAIARAFASNPTVLFADEPTGNLDTRTGELVTDLLFELNREYQTTLVLVTHDVRVASRCNRSLFLDAGHLVSADDESVAPLQRGAT